MHLRKKTCLFVLNINVLKCSFIIYTRINIFIFLINVDNHIQK
jgi:hypothetical protein